MPKASSSVPHVLERGEGSGGRTMWPVWLWELIKAVSRFYDYVRLGIEI